MKKTIALLGLLTLALGFTLISCSGGGEEKVPEPAPDPITYRNKNAKGDIYALVIDTSTNRSREAAPDWSGATYTLTITLASSGETKVSKGMVLSSIKRILVLLPLDEIDPFRVTVSPGGDITAVTGTIIFDDSTTLDGAAFTEPAPEPEPVKPVEPTQPVVPAQPTEPVQPIKPEPPVEPEPPAPIKTDAEKLQGKWHAPEGDPDGSSVMQWVFTGNEIAWNWSDDGVIFVPQKSAPGTFVLDETKHRLTLTFAPQDPNQYPYEEYTYSFTDDTTLVTIKTFATATTSSTDGTVSYIEISRTTWTKQE